MLTTLFTVVLAHPVQGEDAVSPPPAPADGALTQELELMKEEET